MNNGVNRMKYIIPNGFTMLNLLCGCAGLVYAFQEHLLRSALCIGLALAADFLDGFTARLLNARSGFGKQLDSLADMITFGLLPGMILFQMISIGFGEYFIQLTERQHVASEMLGFLIPVCAAVRLARFNLDETQHDTFKGMPTPAVALFIASFPIILDMGYKLNYYPPISKDVFETLKRVAYWDAFDVWQIRLMINPYFYISVGIACSFLMLLPVRMFSLKFKSAGWKKNKIRYVFLITLALLAVLVALPNIFYIRFLPYLDYLAIPLVVIIYLLLSFANGLISSEK